MTQDPQAIPPSPYSESLGIRQFDLGSGRARSVLDVGALPANRRGDAHGGLLATLLDSTLAAAVVSAAPGCHMMGTVNLDLHFLRPGRGVLTADALALRVGGSIGVAQGSVVDEQGATIAVATGSFRIKRPARAKHEP